MDIYTQNTNIYNYPNDGDSYQEFYNSKERRQYSSRLLKYNIINNQDLSNLLTSSCNAPNCIKCLTIDGDFCIMCNDNFIIKISDEDGRKCIELKFETEAMDNIDESTTITL